MIAAVTTVAVVFAAVVLLAALQTAGWMFVIGRYKRNRATYTNLVVSRPPVPEPVAIPIPEDATAEDVEELVYDAWFRAIVVPEFPQYAKDFDRPAA